MNKQIMDIDESNDFGFTFASERDIVNPEQLSLENQVVDLKERLKQVHDIFMPLLVNLSKDPEKPMIRWPNRQEILQKQISKLKSLTKI